MNEMILERQGEDSTRFPPIGKGAVSQSMVNLSIESNQIKADSKIQKKLAKKQLKNEIIVEDSKEKERELK